MHPAPNAQSHLSSGYKRNCGIIAKRYENKDVDSVSVQQLDEFNQMYINF
jgi:hypothetical protein